MWNFNTWALISSQTYTFIPKIQDAKYSFILVCIRFFIITGRIRVAGIRTVRTWISIKGGFPFTFFIWILVITKTLEKHGKHFSFKQRFQRSARIRGCNCKNDGADGRRSAMTRSASQFKVHVKGSARKI